GFAEHKSVERQLWAHYFNQRKHASNAASVKISVLERSRTKWHKVLVGQTIVFCRLSFPETDHKIRWSVPLCYLSLPVVSIHRRRPPSPRTLHRFCRRVVRVSTVRVKRLRFRYALR